MIRNIAKKIYSVFRPPSSFLPEKFWEYYNFLLKSQWWSSKEYENYQWEKLKHILDIAFNNIPFYSDLYKKSGISREDITCLDDYRKLPIINKQTLNNYKESMVNPQYPENDIIYATTGGSTAEPVGYYREKNLHRPIEFAFSYRRNSWFGVKPGDAYIELEAKVVDNKGNRVPFVVDYLRNMIAIAYPDLDIKHIDSLKKIIKRYKPKLIRGYPSALFLFAKYVEKDDFDFSYLKGLASSSENLYSFQREFIENLFHKKVFDYYGMSERVAVASECELHSGLHVLPEYGLLELVNSEQQIVGSNEIGRVVGTGLHNLAMPLIRYDVGDMAQWADNECKCGRKMPMLKTIEGRVQDLLVTGNKRLISMTSINMHNSLFDNVQQYQFFQEKIGETIIRIIPLKQYSDNDTKTILDSLYSLIGDDINLELKLVDNIPLTRLGKHRFLDQKLDVLTYL